MPGKGRRSEKQKNEDDKVISDEELTEEIFSVTRGGRKIE